MGTSRFQAEAEELASELKRKIRGEVRFDDGSRALYATDLSMYRQVPIGVVIPRDIEDAVETVAACRRLGVPILGRGCGTSLAGQCCNVAVVIDFSKYVNRILDLDPVSRTAWIEPGVINDQLRDAAEVHNLTLAPDPATHAYCTLGGMIGNNSCGAHSAMGGKTVDNVEELDILTYDGLRLWVGRTDDAEFERIIDGGGRQGEIFARLKDLRDRYADEVRNRYQRIPRRVSGYNLDELLPENGFHVARALVGSESTCVIVLGAKMRLVPSPPKRALLVIGYPDLGAAGDQVSRIMEHGPTALEAFHEHVIENMAQKGKPLAGAKLLPGGDTWLLVEFGGWTQEEATDRAREAMKKIGQSRGPRTGMKVFEDPSEQSAIWRIREAGVGASRVPGVEDSWPGWEDSAVAPEKLGDYLRDLVKLLNRYDYAYTFYGHFGQGCTHMRATYDLKTADGVKKFRSFMNVAADLVVSYGGSLSGEHGDGQARGELLPKMFGPEVMQAFREFKSIWDPEWKMNPGKVIDAYPLDSNLRVGPDYNPRPVETHFQFPEDRGSFALATERCFGVGLCRSLGGQTMCPSFMVTREEMHTTRGRAHLLFEMLRGDALKGGWRDEHVKEALDLCLSCKGCKGDCPVSVDIATYKAEFLSHYYAGRLRPRNAYAFGLVMYWLRLGARMPSVANFLTQTPLLRDMAKLVAGMSLERQIPVLAPQTFKDWFARRGVRNEGRPRVILWADTFNNHFHTATAQAAVEVLEDAGYQVEVPTQSLCCGRPLYEYGMLSLAKRLLRQVLDTLAPQIQEGVPIVGLEPSCMAVFRDELMGLFPNDENAKRLSQQSFLLSEFLEKKVPNYQSPKLPRKAIIQGHCHHKAIMGMDDETALLSKLGLDFEILESGCCGMAGSFGLEKGERYDVSMKEGERVLLPAVRNAAEDTIIIADGFSCRDQIAQTTDRHALHLAEVLNMALRAQREAPPLSFPELAYSQEQASYPSGRMVAVAAAASLLTAGGVLWLAVRRSRRP